MDWWTESLAGTGAYVMQTGVYNAVDIGGAAIPPSNLEFRNFWHLTPAQANGTWTLTVTDSGGGDLGDVTAAQLRITLDDSVFLDGFESNDTTGWDSTVP